MRLFFVVNLNDGLPEAVVPPRKARKHIEQINSESAPNDVEYHAEKYFKHSFHIRLHCDKFTSTPAFSI